MCKTYTSAPLVLGAWRRWPVGRGWSSLNRGCCGWRSRFSISKRAWVLWMSLRWRQEATVSHSWIYKPVLLRVWLYFCFCTLPIGIYSFLQCWETPKFPAFIDARPAVNWHYIVKTRKKLCFIYLYKIIHGTWCNLCYCLRELYKHYLKMVMQMTKTIVNDLCHCHLKESK